MSEAAIVAFGAVCIFGLIPLALGQKLWPPAPPLGQLVGALLLLGVICFPSFAINAAAVVIGLLIALGAEAWTVIRLPTLQGIITVVFAAWLMGALIRDRHEVLLWWRRSCRRLREGPPWLRGREAHSIDSRALSSACRTEGKTQPRSYPP